MMQLLRIELFKIFSRPRTYISFAIIAAISGVIQLAMLSDGGSFVNFAMQGVNEQFDIQGKILNGYLVTYITLQSLLIHIPLLVALVAGDAFAGEAGMGTLRLLLTKPVSRTQLVLAKFLGSLVYTLLLLIWLAIVSLGVSLLLFGPGDLINLKSDAFVLIMQNDILWRYAAAFAFAGVAMMSVSSMAILLSVFADNAIGPIISTMGIIIVLTILSNLELPLFTLIKPYLLTTHVIGWKGFFDDPVPYHAIAHSALVLVIYTIVFVGAAILFFKRKDIKS